MIVSDEKYSQRIYFALFGSWDLLLVAKRRNLSLSVVEKMIKKKALIDALLSLRNYLTMILINFYFLLI